MRGEGDFVGPLPGPLEGIGCGEAGARTAAALRVRDDVGSMKMSISYRDDGPRYVPCGHPYTECGGESSERRPVGARQLCAECATGEKGRCPTYRVPVEWK